MSFEKTKRVLLLAVLAAAAAASSSSSSGSNYLPRTRATARTTAPSATEPTVTVPDANYRSVVPSTSHKCPSPQECRYAGQRFEIVYGSLDRADQFLREYGGLPLAPDGKGGGKGAERRLGTFHPPFPKAT